MIIGSGACGTARRAATTARTTAALPGTGALATAGGKATATLSATAWPAAPGSASAAARGRGTARQQPLALQLFARKLAGPADRLGLLTCFLFGGFFEMVPELHFPEDALALELLFERLEGLIDVVVADEYLQAG